jgi:hypothetical protein
MITKNIRLRFPPTDTTDAIGRDTLMRLTAHFGMSETETVHYALRKLAKEVLPAYEPDDGDLTPRAGARCQCQLDLAPIPRHVLAQEHQEVVGACCSGGAPPSGSRINHGV